VLVFLCGEAEQDVAPLGIFLAIREVFLRCGRFHFPPPHLLDGGEIDLVERHQPTSFSKTTTVAMPAAINNT
jgi:hypothetical protein